MWLRILSLELGVSEVSRGGAPLRDILHRARWGVCGGAALGSMSLAMGTYCTSDPNGNTGDMGRSQHLKSSWATKARLCLDFLLMNFAVANPQLVVSRGQVLKATELPAMKFVVAVETIVKKNEKLRNTEKLIIILYVCMGVLCPHLCMRVSLWGIELVVILVFF